MKLSRINHGIAFLHEYNGEKIIEINAKLYKYPRLWWSVVRHEIDHYYCDSLIGNLWIDIKDLFDLKKQIMLAGFTLLHPTCIFTQMTPLLFINKRVSVNWFNTIYWSLALIIFILILISVLAGR